MRRRPRQPRPGESPLTTTDTPDGRYTWEVSPTPTAETILVNFRSESQQPHALIFARLGEGYTVDEAVELEGRKGSATEVIRTYVRRAGESRRADNKPGLPSGRSRT